MKNTYNPNLAKDGIIVDQIFTSGHMLIGGKPQKIHEESTTQNYDIGTRWQIDDRVFRYCKAGEALTAMKAGFCGNAPTEVNSAAEAYAIGDTEITILDTNVRVADYYKNGYIWIMKSGAYQFHKIKSSTAGAGVSVTLTLWEPLSVAIGASTFVTAWPSIYSNILGSNSGYMSNAAIPLIAVTSGYYFWGQTWGPCFGTVFNEVPGAASGDRELYFNIDGALKSSKDVDFGTAGNAIPQRAGFLLTNTTGGGDQWYMLQLSP